MFKTASMQAFQFESDLERIQIAFLASIRAMERDHADAERAHDEYEASGEDDDEYDEDGVLTSSTRHALQWEAMKASMAQTVIREAFTTSLFHFWETSARYWTGYSGRDFRELRRAVKRLGYPVDSDGLTLLNKLNNLLKHDSVETGETVYELAPHLFWHKKRPTGAHWRGALRLTNADVMHFFDVVKRSGPTYP